MYVYSIHIFEFVHAIELYCKTISQAAGPCASHRAGACKSCAGTSGTPTEKGRAGAGASAQTHPRAEDVDTLDDHKWDRVSRNLNGPAADRASKIKGQDTLTISPRALAPLCTIHPREIDLRDKMVIGHTDREWIEQQVRQAGFDLAGVAAVPAEGTPANVESSDRFAAWVNSGHAGEMEWLKRVDPAGELIRGDLRRSMPWARSVVVCAINYNPNAPRSIDTAPSGTGWIARYAWSTRPDDASRGSDYHDVLLAKLRAIEQSLHERFDPDLQTRCYVDTGPIVEREYAQSAGIGWIGKNTCLLNQTLGSWLLLGVIITSLDLTPDAWSVLAADRCGTCTRCIDACPTNALTPRQMDATRCISYLTIEKRGPVDESLRTPIGRQVFGCDICQDVCPWNRRAPVAASDALPARAELINPSLEWLASMDGPTFNRTFRGSPLERTGRRRLHRNVAIAMGNSGDPAYAPRLREWSEGEDPVLANAAQWALDKLEE
jgi:epoxyqueuosine reductase